MEQLLIVFCLSLTGFYHTLKCSMVRSVRLACARHSSWDQVYNHYVREELWPFLARGDLKALAMELIGMLSGTSVKEGNCTHEYH